MRFSYLSFFSLLPLRSSSLLLLLPLWKSVWSIHDFPKSLREKEVKTWLLHPGILQDMVIYPNISNFGENTAWFYEILLKHTICTSSSTCMEYKKEKNFLPKKDKYVRWDVFINSGHPFTMCIRTQISNHNVHFKYLTILLSMPP